MNVMITITLTRPSPCPDCTVTSRQGCEACSGTGTCPDVEYSYEVECNVNLGSSASWDRAIGTWIQGDPGEVEILAIMGDDDAPQVQVEDLTAREVERIEEEAFSAAEVE